jgi:hypothetical protein
MLYYIQTFPQYNRIIFKHKSLNYILILLTMISYYNIQYYYSLLVLINIANYLYICYVPINFNYFNLINSVIFKNKLNHCYVTVIILYISNSSYKFLSKNAMLNSLMRILICCNMILIILLWPIILIHNYTPLHIPLLKCLL